MYCLRALFFAHENREQIVKLITETFTRLSVATGDRMTTKLLWEKLYAIMTDAVTKNLNVESEVAQILGSNHIPKHILCK